MKVADIILQQLGGNKFIAMTGSKNFLSDNNGNTLLMNLTRNMSGANRLSITLTSMDDYTMKFYKVTGGKMNMKTFEFTPVKTKDIKIIKGVYCDQLQEIFTENTGLYTKLF